MTKQEIQDKLKDLRQQQQASANERVFKMGAAIVNAKVTKLIEKYENKLNKLK